MVKDESFASMVKNKHRYPLLPVLFNIALKVVARAISQEKEMKDIQIGKEKSKTIWIHRWHDFKYGKSQEPTKTTKAN